MLAKHKCVHVHACACVINNWVIFPPFHALPASNCEGVFLLDTFFWVKSFSDVADSFLTMPWCFIILIFNILFLLSICIFLLYCVIRNFASRCRISIVACTNYLPLGDDVCVFHAKCWLRIKGSFPCVFIESVWWRICSTSPSSIPCSSRRSSSLTPSFTTYRIFSFSTNCYHHSSLNIHEIVPLPSPCFGLDWCSPGWPQ